MRLSGWGSAAPRRESMSAKVLDAMRPVLAALGAEPDPECWLAWGDDPEQRYAVLIPTAAGLVVCHVRVNVAGEGPRASGRLVRWGRAQIGELAVENQGGHRLVTTQVEGQILRGADAEADRVAAFVLSALAVQDGRPLPATGAAPRRRSGSGAATGRSPRARAVTTKPHRPGRSRAAGSSGAAS